MQKGNVIVIILIIVSVVVTAGIFGWLFLKKVGVSGNEERASVDIPSDWKLFESSQLKYRLSYPSDLEIAKRSSSIYIEEINFKNAPSTDFEIIVTKKSQSVESKMKMTEAALPGMSQAGFQYTYKISDVKISDQAGKKMIINRTSNFGNDIITHSYINRGDFTYEFSCSYVQRDIKQINPQANSSGVASKYDCSTFDKMLSTLEF